MCFYNDLRGIKYSQIVGSLYNVDVSLMAVVSDVETFQHWRGDVCKKQLTPGAQHSTFYWQVLFNFMIFWDRENLHLILASA